MQWISVKDKLPHDTQLVIVFGTREHDLEENIWLARFFEEVTFIEDGIETTINDQYFEKTNGYDVESVTHWMPLPTCPEKEEN